MNEMQVYVASAKLTGEKIGLLAKGLVVTQGRPRTEAFWTKKQLPCTANSFF